ncbi:MAG: bifunctional 2-keto-4-hydroxyglutarate aldolase/2-keto-3-deoxy-6-phosphogluconate aldolase [Selenomonadaceae bacterium]|nr:bifunctional 2-keto-4-hydroxyglutarate aldolase/2-keto-3-deoxy-6-phosphogluconate aldolase [Selenomonadaceae bacterium]
MDKSVVMQKLSDIGVVAVVRGKTMEDGVKTADACIAGGVKAIELAFTTPDAPTAIKTLVDKYANNDSVVIGAGTVLEPTTARLAIIAGAKFIVSPAFDKDVVEMCNLYRVVSCPGVLTPAGVVDALKAGADIIKIFPGDIVGLNMIKDIHGPLPQAQLMPSGGVNAENAADWLKAGCVAVSAGGSLTAGAKKGDYAAVTEMAKKFVAAVESARK